MTPPDPPSFEEHAPWAIRVALGIAGRQGTGYDRKDVIQEALLALHFAVQGFDLAKGDDFKVYAQKRIAGAVCRKLTNDRRRRAVEIVFGGEEELYALLEGPGDAWARANRFAGEAMDAIAEASRMAETVARLDGAEDAGSLLARLDPDEIRLIDLKHRQGVPWEEVGAAFGIKARAAKYRAAKLREKLDAMLAKGGR
jgi:RNA polymerase sigma factor for flagellar operon FliA